MCVLRMYTSGVLKFDGWEEGDVVSILNQFNFKVKVLIMVKEINAVKLCFRFQILCYVNNVISFKQPVLSFFCHSDTK